jgi:hypothetical protein
MQATSAANNARDVTSAVAEELRTWGGQASSAVTDKLSSGMKAVKGAAGAAKDAAETASGKARDLIGDHVLIGGLGIAIGAIIAAAFPETRAEAKVMGKASERVKKTATEGAQSAFDAPARPRTASSANSGSNLAA